MISDRIREIRKLLDLNQAEFGKRLGAGRGAIASYETGRTEPTEVFLDHLSDVFGINKDWLVSGNGDIFLPKNEDEELLKIVAEAMKYANEDIKEAIRILGSMKKEHFDVMFNMLKIMSDKTKSR